MVTGITSKQELSKWLEMVGMLGAGIIWERRSGKIIHVKSKTKCIHFSNKKVELAKIFLNDDHLPWVDSAKHV